MPMVKKITAVLYAADIEPCVKFWVKSLGFTQTAEVVYGGKLSFAMLQKGDVEVMYQTHASAEEDVPSLAYLYKLGPTFLFIEVDNLEEVILAVQDAKVAIKPRTTIYGAKEYGIFDPAGHVILFAQFS
jgi:uncharacterized glyoxalase superfamily protein PhnB